MANPDGPRTESDLDLLEAWRAGDIAAGDALVSRHWASISRFFRTKVGDDGADLISQTFLACVEGKDRIAGDNIKAYLFATARRRLADHLRRRTRRPQIDFALSSIADLGAAGPATELDRARQGALLHEAMQRIPLDDQIAIELAYFENLPNDQIATVLDIAENTVRSRLSRARAKLREILETLGTPDEAALAESQLDPA